MCWLVGIPFDVRGYCKQKRCIGFLVENKARYSGVNMYMHINGIRIPSICSNTRFCKFFPKRVIKTTYCKLKFHTRFCEENSAYFK